MGRSAGFGRLTMRRRPWSWRASHFLWLQGKGWHPVKMKVNRRGVKVAVREGYFVG